MSFDEYRIGGYGDESVQKALGGAGDGELRYSRRPVASLTEWSWPRIGKRRSVSPKKRITPPRQTRDPTRTSKSPLSAPSRPHTPNGSPPRHVANELIIDPDLLDAEGESDNAQFISTDKTDLAAEGQNTARQLDKGQQQLLQVQLPGGVPQVDVPHGHSEGLRLQTTNLGVNDSQPPTASSESPSTPAVLGMEGIYANQYDMSRPSSMTDLGSYVAATKGISTNTSSESGYELGGYADPEFDAGQGIPPPRPKKSHARKVRSFAYCTY